jgi:hypothetical protein
VSPTDANPAVLASRLAELEARTELVETLTQATDAELRALLLPLFIEVRELRAGWLEADRQASSRLALTARLEALSGRLLQSSTRLTTLEFDFTAFRLEASQHFGAIVEALRQAQATSLEQAEALRTQVDLMRRILEETLTLVQRSRTP